MPDHYRPVFRELYRATDEELGWTAGDQDWLPIPPALPVEPPEKVSPEILAYLSTVLAEYVKADRLIGPRYLVPAVQSQLPLIEQLCQSSRGPDRRGILAMGAQFAEFCGWLYQDSDQAEHAVFWTYRALDYAQELNEPQSIGYILMRRSNIATDFGRPGQALGLANASLAALGNLTPQIRAASLRQVANAHALLSERREFEAAVDQALMQAEAGADQDVNGIAAYCTPSYVEMEAGMSWVRLGETDTAVEVFEQSLRTWPTGQETRDRGLCLARLATATAAQGDFGRSCQAGNEAVAVGLSTGSARIRRQLIELSTYLAGPVRDPDVSELRTQIAKVA